MQNYLNLLFVLQNWIRRKNRKRKAAEEIIDDPKIMRQLTSWQCFVKKFAETEGKVHPSNVYLSHTLICRGEGCEVNWKCPLQQGSKQAL